MRRPSPLLVVVLAVAALAGVLGAVLGAAVSGRSPEVPEATAPPAPLLGVFRETDRGRVEEFQQWLGAPLSVVVDFSARDTWEQISRPRYMLEEWAGSGLRPVYGVALLPEADDGATMQAGAAGEYDEHFRTLARELVQAGQADAVLRLGWEFNLEGSRWATPDDRAFVGYWRRVVAAMRSVEGQRLSFDWNVNNGSGNLYDAVLYYPGDDVVDYVGVDVYDQSGRPGTYPYPPGCDDACRQERQLAAWTQQIHGGDRGLAFWREFARSRDKPLSLPEWGLWARTDGTGGGDNPFFLERMHEFISDPDNRVAYHAYFDVDGTEGQHRLRGPFPRAGQLFAFLWGRTGRELS